MKIDILFPAGYESPFFWSSVSLESERERSLEYEALNKLPCGVRFVFNLFMFQTVEREKIGI
jgi:hypothetical protein